MKKLAIILGSVMLIAAIGHPVLAHGPRWGSGHHRMAHWGNHPGYCWDNERDYGKLTTEQRTQLDNLEKKFYDETATLRNEMGTKSGELNALLNTSNPDAEKGKALQKEISDIRTKIAEKRLEYELEARKIAPEGTFARGYGRGYGHHMQRYGGHMGGYGPGSCWN